MNLSKIAFSWTDHGLQIRTRCPAIRRGVPFHQILVHHCSRLAPATRNLLTHRFRHLPRDVTWGDGSPIDDGIVDRIEQAYEEVAVEFDWEPGDVLLIDNRLWAHARKPFRGDRQIVVALADREGPDS